MEILEPYKVTVLVLGLTGILFWVQLAVVDVVGITVKHPPGFTIEQNQDSFLFRSHRVLANSNESAGAFALLTAFAMLSSANAAWLNGLTVAYLFGRSSHMLFYYANLKLLRSAAFAVSFFSLLAIF